MKQQHAIKIEDLKLDNKKADAIVDALNEFLLDLGYSKDRIDNLECRHRDGFSPYSHNKGGLEAGAFSDQYSFYCMGGTGFENADETINEYQLMNVEYFAEEKGISKRKAMGKKYQEELDEYCANDDQSTILFSVDLMLTDENTLNVRMCVCVKDAPYHRNYDDKIDVDIKFKSVVQLKSKLNKLLNNKEIKQFSKCLMDAY